MLINLWITRVLVDGITETRFRRRVHESILVDADLVFEELELPDRLASGPGLRVTIEDPEGAVTAGILLDAIQELRGAGAEAIQVDGVRIVVSSYVDGDPGELVIDGQPISAPYDLRAVGPSDDLTVALNVSGGVVADVARFGGTARVTQTDDVVVDAIRPPTGE